MTPTPTEQRPQECKHMDGWWNCMKRAEYIDEIIDTMELCPYYPNQQHCPDFTPKTEKDVGTDLR